MSSPLLEVLRYGPNFKKIDMEDEYQPKLKTFRQLYCRISLWFNIVHFSDTGLWMEYQPIQSTSQWSSVRPIPEVQASMNGSSLRSMVSAPLLTHIHQLPAAWRKPLRCTGTREFRTQQRIEGCLTVFMAWNNSLIVQGQIYWLRVSFSKLW